MMVSKKIALISSVAVMAMATGSAALAQANAVAQRPATNAPANANDARTVVQDLAPQTPAPAPAVGSDNQQSIAAADIIVTGSSIRGAPPVGSNLISVGRAEIEDTAAQTVQQILKTVPAVTGLNSVGQGGFGSADGSGTNAPTIHGLGASASNSTLVLIDGHRLPLSGINHTLGDPNIIPAIAIERVEVLPDGASAVYGSDAVAGVINFITRRKYEGIEANGQVGFADGGYRTYNGSLLAGKTWDTGNALIAYNYSNRSHLLASERAFTRRNHVAQGGSNLASFNCAPASIQATGSTTIFAAPYAAANGVSNAQANAFCDYSGVADLIPESKSDTASFKLSQEIGDRLTVSGNAAYANRRNKAINSRGTITATIFGPGSGRGTQINPYYVGATGSTATSETVRFDANDLLGAGGSYTLSGAETLYFNGDIEYKVGNDWRITLGGLIGTDTSRQQTIGSICTTCAYLALNGTTNAAGSLTTASIPATGVTVTQALTPANTLDVFNLLSTNRTSAALRTQLTDSTETTIARQSIKDATLKLDGTLFTLPGGEVKTAIGGEVIRYTLKQDITRSLNVGPSSTGSATTNLVYNPRSVRSAFVEALIPIVGPEMELPLVRSFTINLSGRYDHYSDFGSTKNPKIAANWEIIEGLKLRGNYAKSFVAPALTSRGANASGVTGESGYAGSSGTNNIPISLFPTAAQIPGCIGQTVTCVTSSAIQGIQISGGNANLKPQKGRTYSLGADFNPRFIPGFRMSGTYWYNRIRGGITSATFSQVANSPGLNQYLQIFPNGATPAQIAAATQGLQLTGSIPATAYYIFSFVQQNVLNLDVSGIDFDASYSRNTGIGRFSAGVSFTKKLKFDQSYGALPQFSVLGTTGANTTFPSITFEGRANIGWNYAGISADLFLNHTGRYHNYSGNTVLPITRDANGNPAGGGDRVSRGNIFDLHVGYTIPQTFIKKANIFVDVQNLFDKTPIFYNSNNGYDTFSGNPLKRIITFGLRTSF